ncbi:MAG: hypothetical protein AB1798_22860 [Spirochaetota bacterium]
MDFLLREGINDFTLIQVAISIDDYSTRTGELSALMEALEELDVKKGYIITENDEEELTLNGKTVEVIPVYKWLLSSGTEDN